MIHSMRPAAEGEKLFHVGATPGGPFHGYTLGGVSFPTVTQIVEPADRENPIVRKHQRAGAYVYLTAEEEARVRDAINRKVVRMMAKGGRGILLATDAKTYRARRDIDRPVAEFVYMVEVATPEAVMTHLSTPAPLAEQEAAASEKAARELPDDERIRAEHRRAKRDARTIERG